MKQEKSFKELFPELVGEEFDYPKDMLKTRCAIGDYEKVLSLKIIKEKCLSKQRVKEAIERGKKSAERLYKNSGDSVSQSAHRGSIYAFESLLKELGLGD